MLLLVSALAGCALDNSLEAKDGVPAGFDTGSPPPFETGETGDPPPPEEICNGLDDDGDGQVDEGFPDSDSDGVADCMDQDCVAEEPAPRSDLRDDCQGDVETSSPPARPWEVSRKWQYSGGGVVSTPAVGDLDGDGVPEVVFDDDQSGGRTVVVDGRTGVTKWSVTGMDAYSGPSLGDVDGDGRGDVITSSGGCFSPHIVYAYNATGVELWHTPIGTACETFANITDLDGDGNVEVIMNEYVLDGATGAVETVLPAGSNNWGAPAVADMDQDGDLEILLDNGLYDKDGTLLWRCGAGGTGTFPQPVNIDSDPEGEFLAAAPGTITMCDDTGAVLWTHSSGGYGSAIAVADFDNDGVQEFAFAALGSLYLIESDGRDRWVAPVSDYSGLAGATSWDVDYDGVPEVVYADEVDILVLNGASGVVEIRDGSHDSWTASETPAVADVDGDGHGDLVYSSPSGAYMGVTVLSGTDGDWPYSRPVYNQYTYYGANVEDDLSIPTYTEAPWEYPPNIFRGQPSAVYSAGVPNLVITIADVCFASCADDGRVDAWVQVWNNGGQSVRAGTPVTLYGRPGGVRSLIETRLTSIDLDPGTSEEMLFSFTAAQAGTLLEAAVDEAGDEDECDETDNTTSWADIPCY